ncbi:MAG: site-specific integrase [Gammaproteobacteria bacterium]
MSRTSIPPYDRRTAMMKAWYEKSINALQLNGKGERTQEAYTRSVRMLVEFYHKTRDLITEEELQHYFLHRRNVDQWSPATLRICYSGLRFFFEHVLHRDWHTLKLIHPNIAKNPVVRRLTRLSKPPGNATVPPGPLDWLT